MYYFLSDFHLGIPNYQKSLEREKRVVAFLDNIKCNAIAIYFVGDLFDFWFEHRYTVPKGFVRLLGKMAELTDKGIQIHIFTGNHDMWMFGYLEQEIGAVIHRSPIQIQIDEKKFLIGHGDGLGPGDFGYKFIKKIFANPICQWLFARLHPNLSFGIANYWSKRSRLANRDVDEEYLGDNKEYLMVFCNEMADTVGVDYFIFGHRHLPLDKKVGTHSRYINLGDWIRYFTYATWDGKELLLKEWKS
jgi:UDP-2,3-diacylglucosamine hydrolase